MQDISEGTMEDDNVVEDRVLDVLWPLDDGLDTWEATFEKATLFIAPTSVGNVGQLSAEMLLLNLESSALKVASINHPALEAVVGSGSDLEGSIGFDGVKMNDNDLISTACELFIPNKLDDPFQTVPDARNVIMLFRAPVAKNGRSDFIKLLSDWIKIKGFRQVVCLSSICSDDRVDAQLVGFPFRYLTTAATPEGLLETLKGTGMKPLEPRQFPAPTAGSGDDMPFHVHVPGGGITKELYTAMESMNLPFVAVMVFASEGDSSAEALTLFQLVERVFNLCKLEDLHQAQVPRSMSVMSSNFPAPMY